MKKTKVQKAAHPVSWTVSDQLELEELARRYPVVRKLLLKLDRLGTEHLTHPYPDDRDYEQRRLSNI